VEEKKNSSLMKVDHPAPMSNNKMRGIWEEKKGTHGKGVWKSMLESDLSPAVSTAAANSG
jgi:hypothetical protein